MADRGEAAVGGCVLIGGKQGCKAASDIPAKSDVLHRVNTAQQVSINQEKPGGFAKHLKTHHYHDHELPPPTTTLLLPPSVLTTTTTSCLLLLLLRHDR